jgi:hypothetical protein
MDLTDLGAACAFLISILAAAYARWAGKAAQRANEIALHNQRLTIYKGLQAFHMALLAGGVAFQEDAIWRFSDHANLSEFYFPAKQYKVLQELVDDANAVKTSHILWESIKDVDVANAMSARIKLYEEFRALTVKCKTADADIRDRLRLDRTGPSRLV